MATIDSALEVCRAYIEARKPARKLASLHTFGGGVFSYGDHWPLLVPGTYVRNADLHNAYLVNIGKVSATTSRHQRAAERALSSAGYVDTGQTVNDTVTAYRGYEAIQRTHTYAVWRKPV